MQFIDTVGFSMLKDTHHDNKEIGVQVLLANCGPSIRHCFPQRPDAAQVAEQWYQVHQESREKKDALLDPEDPHIQTSL